MKEKMHMKRLLSVILTVCMLVTLIGMVPMNCNAALIEYEIQEQRAERIIFDGVCFLKNKKTGRMLDIVGPSTESGVKMHQWDFYGHDSQKWELEIQSDGYYTIKSLCSHLYLSVKNNSSDENAEIIQLPGGNEPGQRWRIYGTGRGTYKLIPKCSENLNKCLAVGNYLLNINGIDIKQKTYSDNTDYQDEWIIVDADAILSPYVSSTTIKIKCIGDITNSNEWYSLIELARNSWNNAGVGANISLIKGENSATSSYTCEVNNYPQSWYGITYSYYNSDKPTVTTLADIKINAAQLPNEANPKQSTIAHEMGHLFGLDDDPPVGYADASLMSHNRNRNVVIAPQSYDVDNVKFVYNK